MKKLLALLLGLIMLLGMMNTASAVVAPAVYCDGDRVYSREIYEYDLADGSLSITWAKQSDAASYYCKVIGLNEAPDFEDSYQSNRGTVLTEKDTTSTTTSGRKVTVSTSKMEDYTYLKIAVATYDDAGKAYWLNFGVELTDSRGYASVPEFDDYTARKIYDFDITSASSLRIDYYAENADAYYVRAILLNEVPSSDQYQSDRAVGTVYENDSRSSEYVSLSTSKMKGAQYMKVAVGAYGTKEDPDEAHWAWIGFRLTGGSDDGEISLSDSSISLGYKGGSDTVTVSGASSYTVSHPTEDETTDGNQWLTVTKSGSTITLEARPNYGASSRSETVTVTSSSGDEATIKVTQQAGYAAPTASLYIGDAAYSNGSTYGPLANGGEDILWLYVKVSNAQRIYVTSGDTTIGHVDLTIPMTTTAVKHECAFKIPAGVTPGTYTFTIYVSNSEIKNDEWAQSITPMTLKVNVIGAGSSSDPFPPYGSTLLDVAKSQLGYKGSSSSSNTTGANVTSVGDYTKYGVYTGTSGQDWCASFVSWCANQAGVSGIKKSAAAGPGQLCTNAYSKGGVVYFNTLNSTQKANHPYLETYGIKGSRSDYTPAPGDLIFFRWSTAGSSVTFSHVGIVSKVSGSTVYYIDGNGSGDVVKERSKSLTSTDIAAYCKVSGSFTDDTHVHTWDNGSVTTQASCTTEGVRLYTCSGCGETKTETIPAAGHTESPIPAIPPTCGGLGLTEGVECSVCGVILVQQEFLQPTGKHTPGSKQIITEPTCSEEGLQNVYCAVCRNIMDEEIIPATGKHVEGDAEVIVEPTCSTEGVQAILCATCGEVIDEELIPATGKHVEGDAEVIVEPTCATEGVQAILCATCGEVIDEELIPATSKHTPGTTNVTVSPTCTTTGKSFTSCSVCGETIAEETIPALGHTEVTDKAVAATCTADGLTEGVHCSRCGVTIIKQEVVPAKGHAWNSGVITLPPTTTAEGVKTFTCTVCKATRTESIPKVEILRLPGDANEDGHVNIFDALAILQYDVGWDVTINLYNANVNADDAVDIFDALLILQYDVGWDVILK